MGKRKRKPLAAGNRYVYKSFPSRGLTIKWFTFEENDGVKGVAVKWFGLGRGVLSSGFYPYPSERAFWSSMTFRHLIDAPESTY